MEHGEGRDRHAGGDQRIGHGHPETRAGGGAVPGAAHSLADEDIAGREQGEDADEDLDGEGGEAERRRRAERRRGVRQRHWGHGRRRARSSQAEQQRGRAAPSAAVMGTPIAWMPSRTREWMRAAVVAGWTAAAAAVAMLLLLPTPGPVHARGVVLSPAERRRLASGGTQRPLSRGRAPAEGR